MNILNNVVMTRYVPSMRAFEEFTKSAIRPYRLTKGGAKRALVNDGTIEQESAKEYTVIRVECAVFVKQTKEIQMNWYAKSITGAAQGLVIDEENGFNVAVTYDAKDAPLLASAPDLLAALEELIKWENGNTPHAVIREARAAIAKAKGY